MKRILPVAAASLVGVVVGYLIGGARPVSKEQRESLEKLQTIQEAFGYTHAEMRDAKNIWPKPQEFVIQLERGDEKAVVVALSAYRKLERGDVGAGKAVLARACGEYYRDYKDSDHRNEAMMAEIERLGEEYSLLAKHMTRSTKFRVAAYSLAVLVGGLVVYALSPRPPLDDAALRQKVVGSWIIDGHRAVGVSVMGECVMRSDGTYFSRQSYVGTEDPLELVIEGTWRIKDGALIETATNTSAPNRRPLGSEVQSRVISADKNELVVESPGNSSQVSFRRR